MHIGDFEEWVTEGTLPDGSHDKNYPESWPELEYQFDGKGKTSPFGHIQVLETTGGMDEGSSATVTFKVGDEYYRKHGYYASHYGYDWDGPLVQVKPVEYTAIRYDKV